MLYSCDVSIIILYTSSVNINSVGIGIKCPFRAGIVDLFGYFCLVVSYPLFKPFLVFSENGIENLPKSKKFWIYCVKYK